MAQTTFNLTAFEGELRTQAAKRLLAAALVLQAEHRKDLSRGNPAPHDGPAAKGEFPKARTGHLIANVGVEPLSAAQVKRTLKARVGWKPAGFYGLALWNRGWKGIKDTLSRARSAIAAALAGSGSAKPGGGP